MSLCLRALVVWLVIVAVESAHGTARTLWLEPMLGELRARKLAFWVACLLILAIATAFARWLRATTPRQRIGVGVLWAVLMLAFEIGLGRFAFGYAWDRILADYDVTRGGPMAFGIGFLGLAPWLGALLRERLAGKERRDGR